MRFQPSLGGTLHLSRTNAFFLGGGKALVNAYYRDGASSSASTIVYDTEVARPRHPGRPVPLGDRRAHGGAQRRSRAKALVAAAGGFESNLAWLEEAWGAGRGQLPRSAARPTTGARCCACCSTRARSRSATRRSAMRRHRRARAEVRRRHRHARRLRVARHRRQPRRASASTTRARISGRSATRSGAGSSPGSPTRSATRSSTPRRSASSCRRSSRRCKARLDRRARAHARARSRRRSRTTVTRFNAAVRPGTFDHTVLDDCRTEGLEPPKTHWARADRHAALLRLPAAARHHLHLPRRDGGRARADAHGRTASPSREHLRRRRDHGGQHPRQGLPRRASA